LNILQKDWFRLIELNNFYRIIVFKKSIPALFYYPKKQSLLQETVSGDVKGGLSVPTPYPLIQNSVYGGVSDIKAQISSQCPKNNFM